MGNSGGRSSGGVGHSQRIAMMEKYRLTDSQIHRVEALFKQSAANKKYLTFKDFCNLYSESRFDHDDEDILAVFRALGERPSGGSSRSKPPDAGLGGKVDRITFDGFVRLTLLCRNSSAESPGSSVKRGDQQEVCHDADNNNCGGGGDCVDASTPAGDTAGDLQVDQDRMRILFDVMDSDSSGTISEQEFHRFILNFVDDKTTASDIFGKLDHDKSRTIDFDEFCAFCRKHRRVFRAMCLYVLPID